ncbi:MAG TPA: RagB/SusD family nutrient uptake outer membrane protein [Chitinophagaceae bacterium]|nr:RagB/SusD family nutrient uptake outer membrane protein [Chitinophagaceae bacterium]
MKKELFIVLIIVTVLGSCKKDLDQLPISTATTETFYKQPSDFVQAVNATYSALRGPSGSTGYPDRLMALSETRSDNIYPSNVVARDADPINNFAPGIAANTYVEEAWNTDFNGIFKANTVLDQIAKNGSYVGNAALATRLSAEARFLRAFFYFDLVRYYGKLPIVTHPVLTAEADTIRRSSVADVYALIISDLQFAIANLPAAYNGTYPAYAATDVGRATKYAAEATLGLVYMTRSGPTYSIEGPGMGLNEWSLAVPLFNDIIGSNLFVFNPSYANIFSYGNQSPAYTAASNREAIFDVMYLSGQNPILGATFPWALVPNTYFSALSSNTVANGQLGFPGVSNDLLNNYAATDTRKSFNIHTTAFVTSGSADAHPFFRKWLDTTKVPTNSRFDWAINFIAIRYTDILMLKAECVLHGAPGSQATDVDAVVNQVRTRAGQPAIAGVTLPQLFDERRREFAGEGSRWFDLQRSGNLLTIMNNWAAVEDAAQHKMNPVINNYIIYPVPQSQLDAQPGLYTQNPGY